MEQIPIEHLELTEAMIAEIKATIHQPLNESLLITLADHISFAIQRKEQGIEFQNPLAGQRSLLLSHRVPAGPAVSGHGQRAVRGWS